MTRHIYSVGQQVSFGERVVTCLKRNGVFTITKLLPPLGAELQYRIKSEGEVHERVASERELQVELEKPIVVAGSRLSSVDVDAARIFAKLIPLATEPPGRSAVTMPLFVRAWRPASFGPVMRSLRRFASSVPASAPVICG